MHRSERGGWILEVQSWHILLLLAVQLIGLGVAYGRISQKQEEQTNTLQQLQQQRVLSKDEFDLWNSQLTIRIDRIERKIDNEYIREK